jgi:malonyl CoA-acyl carrier protein transacylase
MKRRSEKLVITGKPAYIERLAAHLREEHPSTRRRMKVKA